jgi:hypothetical protein
VEQDVVRSCGILESIQSEWLSTVVSDRFRIGSADRLPGGRMEDAIGLRKSAKALEESFFAKENRRLLARLQDEAARHKKREVLAEALNIDDEGTLNHLVDLDLSPEAIVAFSLVPLVEVAWADGQIQSKERDAVLRAAEERGVTPGSVNHELLENWLRERPDPRLLEVWRRYATGLLNELDPDERLLMRERVLGNALRIAESAGGFLGLGSISDAEKAVLEDLESTFG